MFLSVTDLFKIGIGPSSSHTVGPMVAANRFLQEVTSGQWPRPQGAFVSHIQVRLHGSLAFTGKGHASDRAVVLGLAGKLPHNIEPDEVEGVANLVANQKQVTPQEGVVYQFDPDKDLIFDYDVTLPGHTNGMTFTGFASDGRMLLKQIYYSVGGGFVVTDKELLDLENENTPPANVPFPFHDANSMLAMAKSSSLSIAEMKRANELTHKSEAKLTDELTKIWSVMEGSIDRGLNSEGILPGGLSVKRRAAHIHEQLENDWKSNRPNPLAANDWLQVYAMAVNEENAAGGKVVTAPTNGAAGVIPAVIAFHQRYHEECNQAAIEEFLLTAAAIGGLIKHNASISGAEVGCQGEVGSAAAMAAAGLAAIMGGDPYQVENAAEIALEHHLGMTCDPIAGLVQVPCIERNGIGAIKAVSAASLSLKGDGSHIVSLDACIKTMYDTGKDMNSRYKETSQGGLAVNVVAC